MDCFTHCFPYKVLHDEEEPMSDYHQFEDTKDAPITDIQQLLEKLITKGNQTKYVIFQYGSVYICPPQVIDPETAARQVLQHVPMRSPRFLPQAHNAELKVFVYGEPTGFRSIMMITNRTPTQPHQTTEDYVRMLLTWDQERRIIISSGVIE